MSGTELLVVVFGAFIGYWVVSQFSAGRKGNTPHDPADAGPRNSPQPGEPECPESADGEPHPRTAEAEPPPWHEVLQIPPDADIEAIQRAYAHLVSQYHPDKVATLAPEVRELCLRKTEELGAARDRALAARRSGR